MKQKRKSFLSNNLGLSFTLIRGSLSVLLPFEVLYKLIGVNIIMPLASYLVSSTLKLRGINYIAEENLRAALLDPLVIISIFAALLLFTIYTLWEISFLILTFNQCRQELPLKFTRMLTISGMDAVRAVSPRNYPLIILVVVVIPVSNSIMVSSLLGGLEVPNYILEIIFDTPLYMFGIIMLLLVFLFIIVRYMFLFHYYALEDISSHQAAKMAVSLAKGRRIKSLWCFLVCQGVVYLIFTLLASLITAGLSIITSFFSAFDGFYSWLLTLNMAVRSILSFALPALMVVFCYGLLSALYFNFREEDGDGLPLVVLPVRKNNRKENFRFCILTIGACLIGVGGMAYSSAHSGDLGSSQHILVMAHRGASREAPENTLPAFEKSIELGADYIELDVQEAKDGEIIVTHDANLYRCTGLNANVWQLSLPEIQKLNAGRHFPEYDGTKIPSLREVMELCKGKIRLNIELKSNGHEKALEKNVADIITEYEMDNDVVITSLTKKCLINFKKEKPEIPCGYIVSMAVGNYLDVSWSDFFSIEQSFITKDLVREAHSMGKTINAWTVDEDLEAARLIDMQVDSLITNDPLMAREVILQQADPLVRLMRPLEG